MPGAGGGGFNLRQILVLLLVVALTVFLVRQVAWHALLAATGGILFVTAVCGVLVFAPPQDALATHSAPSEASATSRGRRPIEPLTVNEVRKALEGRQARRRARAEP